MHVQELSAKPGDGPDPTSFNVLLRTLVECSQVARTMPYMERLLQLHEDTVKHGAPEFMDGPNLSAMCARIISKKG